MDYVNELVDTVRNTVAWLRDVPESAAAKRPAPAKWSAKEIVGHLIDSAAHNHQRFVRARWQDDLVFHGYDQEAWVSSQGYQDAPWLALLALWEAYNLHIARVMRLVPGDVRLRRHSHHSLDAVGWQPFAPNAPASLDEFMRDYVGHLRHHVRQVEALVPPAP